MRRIIKWVRFTDLPTKDEIDKMILIFHDDKRNIFYDYVDNKFYMREYSSLINTPPQTMYIGEIIE